MNPNKEIEIKVRLNDKKAVQKKLLSLGWTIESLNFQREHRITDKNNTLGEKGIFPRTRKEGTVSTFTIKVNPEGKFKSSDLNKKYFKRLEYDVGVEDADKMAEVLYILGLTEQRVLEKYRQTWTKTDKDYGLKIVIDFLSFGNYIELEGKEEEIEKMINALELSGEERIPLAYWRVYKIYCEKNGLKEEKDLLFKKDEKSVF